MNQEVSPDPVRILLIEDNPADVELTKYALDKQAFRYEMSSLKDGALALAFFRREGKYARAPRPALVVMDLHLPNNDGLEILKEIRETTEFANLPVVVMSSSVSPDEKNSVAAFNGTCFISKPRDLDEFLKVGKRIKQLALEGNMTASGATA